MDAGEERQLVDAALAGGRDAVRRLLAYLTPVVQYRAGVVLLQLRALAGPDLRQDAQDLTQEILLQLFKNDGRVLRAWDPARGAGLRGFVGLLAQRRAISILRTRRGGEQLSDDLHEIEDAGAEGASLDTLVANRQELARILERLQTRLSPLGLELFYRLMCHQEPVEQICREMDLTANAVYVWRTRLAKLVRSLAAELHDEPATKKTTTVVPSEVSR